MLLDVLTRWSIFSLSGKLTGIYSPHSVFINGILQHIRDLCRQHRPVASEDDGSNSSSESDSSMPSMVQSLLILLQN